MSPAAKAQDAVFDLDFGDAPPAQGASYDRIPPGTYGIRLEKMERVTSQSKKPMARVGLRVDEGPFAGKRLGEQFVFPASADDSKFGLQRFHAFLVALGMKEQTKAVRIEGNKFLGRTCIAEVDDEEIPAVYDEDGEQKYPARVRSRTLAFYKAGDPDAPPITNGTQPQQAEAQEPAAPPAPVTAPAPKAKAKAAAAPPTEEEPPAAEAEAAPEADAGGTPDPDSVTAELEDLFGDD